MHHLVNAQYQNSRTSGNTEQLFVSSGGTGGTERYSNCPLGKVSSYTNLIYLLNLQFWIHRFWFNILYYSSLTVG